MTFVPPRCPHPDCPAHLRPEGNWFRRWGSYQPRCRDDPVPRFRCRRCNRGFSRQTFRHDYRDRKPWCNPKLLQLLTSGVGLRQCGRVLQLDVHTVQAKLRKLARTGRALHANLSPRLPAGRIFLLDEEETFEQDSICRLTVPIVIEKETWFLVAADAAPIRRLAKPGSARRQRQDEHERRHGRRSDRSRECVRGALQALARRLEGGTLTLRSDDKASYATLVRSIFGASATHEVTSGRVVRNQRNPLFPINTTIAMSRDNNGRLRRRSWLVSKRCSCLVEQLSLFVVYRNYIRQRFHRDAVDATPATFLQLLPRALRPAEALGWRQDWGERSIHPLSHDGMRSYAAAA